MQFEWIIGAGGVILAAITFYIGRTTSAKSEGKQDGTILSELGYLKSSMDDIKLRLSDQDKRDRDYIGRLVCVEETVKSAHKRIDQLHKE